MNSLMNVRFTNEHNEIVNEPNEIMVVHGILFQKTLQTVDTLQYVQDSGNVEVLAAEKKRKEVFDGVEVMARK